MSENASCACLRVVSDTISEKYPQREQTAATILAALIQAQAVVDGDVLVDDADTLVPGAVKLADALRAELARSP